MPIRRHERIAPASAPARSGARRRAAPIFLTAALIAGAGVFGAGALGAGHRAPANGDVAAFEGDGMWIWYVSRAAGGDPDRIAAKARRRGIETVLVKAGDGADAWRQFTPRLVARLHADGLRVCAWHYVYGTAPVAEARVSAAASGRGADCLVIDAESQYEGRYAEASTYLSELRRRVGASYPVGLAAFPYVHYHPAFPYSVFLGPGGAEFNLPQMYWRAIGDRVAKVFSITYTYNGVYGRPIFPLGQLYMNPPGRQVLRFRRLAFAYGSTGVSWWSWQHATARGWRAASRRLAPTGARKVAPYPELDTDAAGDLVVWAQEHLAAGGYYRNAISGRYGASTARAVARFQLAAGLPRTGAIDSVTWSALLDRLDPEPVEWGRRAARSPARASSAPRVPWSARLSPRANELSPARAHRARG